MGATDRLLDAHARVVFDVARPRVLVALARDLIGEREEGPALLRLAALEPEEPRDEILAASGAVLDERGARADPARTIVASMARDIDSGAITTAAALELLAQAYGAGEHEELRCFYDLWVDDYYLATQGIHGSPSEVLARAREEMDRHRDSAPAGGVPRSGTR